MKKLSDILAIKLIELAISDDLPQTIHNLSLISEAGLNAPALDISKGHQDD